MRLFNAKTCERKDEGEKLSYQKAGETRKGKYFGV